MAKGRTYGGVDHDWWAEIPIAALEIARAWAVRLHASDPEAVELFDSLFLHPVLIHADAPVAIIALIWQFLIKFVDAPDPLRTHEQIFGYSMASHVYAIWKAYKDDPGGVIPEGLEDRARKRLTAGLASPSDLPYLLRQAAAT